MKRWIFSLLCLAAALPALALDNPEHWTMEMRGGIYTPTGSAMKRFLNTVTPSVTLSGGLMLESQYGLEFGVGAWRHSGTALGVSSGAGSQDPFSLWLVPMTLDASYHFDYRNEQLFVPFVKAGGDLIYFHENDAGTVIKGVKYGLHGGGGLKLLLNRWMDGSVDAAINDTFFIIDGRYRWVNNFGSGGLDLSGWLATGGFQVQF